MQKLHDRDLEWQATRGSGAGGQARNKTSNAIQMKHLPTGIAVRVESERSQLQNREGARRLLAARVAAVERERREGAQAESRRKQVGSGQRGDKIRTIRTQEGVVRDHRTSKRMSLARYERGYVSDLL